MEIGFFNLSISGEIGENGKRKIDVKFAKNERYTVPEGEIHEN
jgi:hypothetical protein